MKKIRLCISLLTLILFSSSASGYEERVNSNIDGLYVELHESGREDSELIIYSHGLGGSHRNGVQYANALNALGYDVVLFDFRGGSSSSLSEGSVLNMSIFTELEDLLSIYNYYSQFYEKIILM